MDKMEDQWCIYQENIQSGSKILYTKCTPPRGAYILEKMFLEIKSGYSTPA